VPASAASCTGWNTASPLSTSCTISEPPAAILVSSTTLPVAWPLIVAASLLPVTVTSMTCDAVPSADLTVSVSCSI